MKDLRTRSRGGFTLIELMIVVSLIGALSAIAIPSFLRYQLRAKRSEAYANLAAVAKAQNSYYATYGVFSNTGAPQPGGGLGTTKRLWTPAADAAFATVGFRPEGNVFFDYDVNTACGCTNCFTATAYGDIDGDGIVSALMYVHADAAGGTCPDGVGLGLGTPIENGAPVFDQVAWNVMADEF